MEHQIHVFPVELQTANLAVLQECALVAEVGWSPQPIAVRVWSATIQTAILVPLLISVDPVWVPSPLSTVNVCYAGWQTA